MMNLPFTSALTFSTLATLALCQSTTKTARYDAIPTGAPPSPYKNLTYTNMVVADANTQQSQYLQPSSGKHYIEATNMFDFSITSEDYFNIQSFSLGCTRCVGSECAGGYYPDNCTIAVSAVEAPELPVSTVQVSYVAPAFGTTMFPYSMQKVTTPNAGGWRVHFSLLEGGGETFVFIDDLVYTLE